MKHDADQPSVSVRAQDASLLSTRISSYTGTQATDLIEWIFSNMPVKNSERVLELCAGTGQQSLRFLKTLRDGHLVATDISSDALKALHERAEQNGMSGRLTTVKGDMDALTLDALGGQPFDRIFCAYGLYYSGDAIALLERLRTWLSADGSIVIVGPFGINNKPLLDLLQQADVTPTEYVTFTSQQFMPDVVVPWACNRFRSVNIRTLVNPVTWPNPETVISYWRNTTFFDGKREEKVRTLLDRHFEHHAAFVNEKWIMLAEMNGAR